MIQIDRQVKIGTCLALLMFAPQNLFASTIHEVSFSLTGAQDAFATGPAGRRTPPPGAPLILSQDIASGLSLSFPTPEPDNDRLLTYVPGDPPSYAYAIRAENAADFGLDWEEVENDFSRSLSAVLRFGVDSSPFNGSLVRSTLTESDFVPPLPPKESWQFYHFGPRDVTLDEIKVVVDYYFWHPIFPDLRASKIEFEITGSYLTNVTILAPEPNSLLLAVGGWMAIAAAAKCARRNQRA